MPCFVEYDESENICYKIFKNEENIIESIYNHIKYIKNDGLREILIHLKIDNKY